MPFDTSNFWNTFTKGHGEMVHETDNTKADLGQDTSAGVPKLLNTNLILGQLGLNPTVSNLKEELARYLISETEDCS